MDGAGGRIFEGVLSHFNSILGTFATFFADFSGFIWGFGVVFSEGLRGSCESVFSSQISVASWSGVKLGKIFYDNKGEEVEGKKCD